MLVVTRKRGESIVVGDGIEIQVVSVGRQGVRIGVTAPRDVPVHRREVYDLVVAANRSAARSAPASVSALASTLRSRVARRETEVEASDAAVRLA
ncbi:MAG: carbon storage regulator CsrA [Acidobacteria bacterium]|nr:carbon storage regulator CsrA [Acidobacteriota bacterium]